MEWTEIERTHNCAALSCAGHYVISHRPKEFNLCFRPPNEHHHVGCFTSIEAAKLAAEAHSKGEPILEKILTLVDKPLAIKGLISYRYRGRFTWMMIGARDDADAMNEANRGGERDITIDKLQVWDGTKYINVVEREKP